MALHWVNILKEYRTSQPQSLNMAKAFFCQWWTSYIILRFQLLLCPNHPQPTRSLQILEMQTETLEAYITRQSLLSRIQGIILSLTAASYGAFYGDSLSRIAEKKELDQFPHSSPTRLNEALHANLRPKIGFASSRLTKENVSSTGGELRRCSVILYFELPNYF